MELLIWAGKVSLYWILFYGCFYFFLRNLTHLQWNRYYLLATLLLSLLLPFIQVPESASAPLAVYAGQLDAIDIVPAAGTTSHVPWLSLLGILYASGVVLMGFKLISNLVRLRKLWGEAMPVETEEEGVFLYLFPDNNRIKTFSFLNRIGVSYSDYQSHFDEILTHEMVHIRQRHSIDILLTEILRVVFWFHPVIPLYKKSLQEIHEFLADREIRNRDTYAEFLVAYAFGPSQFTLVNNFYNSSLLKQRIQMLYKNKSSKWKLGLYGITCFLGLALVVFIAACTDKEPVNESQAEENPISETRVEDKVFTAVETNPEFPGGAVEMYKYLSANIKYPTAASRANVQGRVFLQFVVRTDGSINDVMVVKGVGFGCDEEAIRVVKSMPKWEAGKQSGTPVNVKYTLPINFQLEGDESDLPGEPSAFTKPDVKPLYILDGTEINDLENIDKDNIESISVLKDSKAVEAYGPRGKDGVIEISMKKP